MMNNCSLNGRSRLKMMEEVDFNSNHGKTKFTLNPLMLFVGLVCHIRASPVAGLTEPRKHLH